MRERRYGVKRVGGGGSGGDEGGETGQNIFYEKLFIFTKNKKKNFLKIKMKVKRDYVILPWLRSQRQTQIQ